MLSKKTAVTAALLLLLAGILALQRHLPAIRTPFGSPPKDITAFLPEDSPPPQGTNETGLPLNLPPGFAISIFAKNLPGARVMRFDQFGNLWVSRTSEGAVTLLEIQDGKVKDQNDVFTGLRKPHGLAFDPDRPLLLYVAEENRIWRVTTYSDDQGEQVMDLPAGGGHFTRSIAFGSASADPAGSGTASKLYVSVGSSCNVCREADERRAAILRVDPASRTSELFARGLRNAVFFAWDARGRMWATEMGRDWLGDDLPPDEINIVEGGGPSAALGVNDYGWPICYGKNVHDANFDANVYVRDPCADARPSAIDIPAHSAPLGLAFIPPHSQWPEDYWGDLIVAYHGSWNRSQPTGYKVVRHRFDDQGAYQGVEDFITGWLRRSDGTPEVGAPSQGSALTPWEVLGRPVDILVEPSGVAYISDDKAGVIYKVAWRGR